jgi:hypothetical protein
MTAKEIFSCTIEHSYPLSASRAKKPCSEPAIVARRPVKGNGLFNVFPVSTMWPVPVIKNHTVCFHPVTDGAGLFATS